MSERCANCDKPIAREGEHVGGREGSTRYYTCTAHDWRAEAMRLRGLVAQCEAALICVCRACSRTLRATELIKRIDTALASRADDGENK